MKAIHKKRLLKAADIAEEVPREKFLMSSINIRFCDSPACVLGHYFIKHPQALRNHRYDIFDAGTDHFGLTGAEWFDLFSARGCGNAKTGKQAAKYIRAFVKRKEKECSTKS